MPTEVIFSFEVFIALSTFKQFGIFFMDSHFMSQQIAFGTEL